MHCHCVVHPQVWILGPKLGCWQRAHLCPCKVEKWKIICWCGLLGEEQSRDQLVVVLWQDVLCQLSLWLWALSDVLINTYHDHIQPSTIQDPTKNLKVVKSIKAFIDNVTMSNSMNTNTIQDLTTAAQTQLWWWDMLIKVTGGELNPSKCCGTIAHWKPDKFGILCQAHPRPNEIKITLSDMALTHQIPILQQLEGTRYLGVYIAPDGMMQTMENQIWKKVTLYTIAIQWVNTHVKVQSRSHLLILFHPSTSLPPPSYLAVWSISWLNPSTVNSNNFKQDGFPPNSPMKHSLCSTEHGRSWSLQS